MPRSWSGPHPDQSRPTPAGWIGLDLVETTDWEEVAELMETSFRITAPRSLIAELDDHLAEQSSGDHHRRPDGEGRR